MRDIKRRKLLQAGIGGAMLGGVSWPALGQTVRGVTDRAIRLGQMVPLTGPLANYGTTFRDGAQAYVSLVNDRGGVNGRKIELVTDDNVYSPVQSLAIAKKQVGNGIFAMVCSQGTAQVAAVMPYMLEQEKVPIFGTYGGAQEWFNPPREGLFGLQVLHEDSGAALGRWAAKDGARNLLIVHIEAASIAKAAKFGEAPFQKAVKGGGGKVDYLPVKLPTQDWAPIVLQIAQKKPDAIMAFLSEGDFIGMAREMRNQNVRVQLYTWGAVPTQRVIEIGGASVEGVKAMGYTNGPAFNTPAVNEYRGALVKYGMSSKPDFDSIFHFGQMKIFVEALSRVKGALTHKNFYQALYSLKGYDSGIFPPVSFAANRHQGLTSLVPTVVRNGVWVQAGNWIDSSNPNW